MTLLLYGSLGVTVVGNGLFKSNAANLVRRIYEGDDARIDSAFTLYYMAVNIGSTFSIIATPIVAATWGWHAAFTACCAGMALGLVDFFPMRRTLGGVVANYASIPDNITGPMQSLAIYTSLFNKLGSVAAGGELLAIALLPLLKKLAEAHRDNNQAVDPHLIMGGAR